MQNSKYYEKDAEEARRMLGDGFDVDIASFQIDTNLDEKEASERIVRRNINADILASEKTAKEVCELLHDGDSLCGRVIPILINAEKNREFLKTVPHRPFFDLACIYAITYEGLREGWVSFTTVTENNIQISGLRKEELHRAAVSNLLKEGCKAKSIQEILGDEPGDIFPTNMNMMVISNKTGIYGAAVMLNAGFFAPCADKSGSDLFILPSSVHEVIAVPGDIGDLQKAEVLKDIVTQINLSDCITDVEFLSNTVYYYSRKERRILCA